MFRQTWFWIVLTLLAVGCAALSYRLFPQIFPVVTLDIRMDRTHAILTARTLAANRQWGPADGVRDVASFNSDSAQNFIELEGGGKPAFAALLKDDLYSPYTWRVRLFKDSETNQTFVAFKPSGELYGFDETLRQKATGAALPADRAREIAEAAARAVPWQLPLERFKPVETSQVTRPGGRIDHTFVYERPDQTLGEGRLRLRLVVSGDRLTTLEHYVKVPEAFSRRYEEMRSANNAIATGGAMALVVLYILGGCVGGFLFLMRQRAVLWRQPLIAASLVTVLQFAAGLNAWPLVWMNYDTALSSGGFITERIVLMVTGTLVLGFVFFISFLAAEGLSRRAFPQHPQLWRLWSRDAAASPEILGRTLGGYLLAAVMLLYVVVFYYFAIGQLGWWSPSEALVDPNSLAHYWPWLTPLANAAQAGIWEEMLFRAVPLAGAALLGRRFGGRKWWIAGTLLLQAMVFAAGHANYPGQPAYSRLVELILPALFFGALYLRFGLLPAIVMHFTYDVVLMSLPLFAATADGIWLDRSLVMLLALLPLWLVLWRRWRAGSWSALPAGLWNSDWSPPALPAAAGVTATPIATPAAISDRLIKGMLIAGLGGLIVWVIVPTVANLGAPLKISRTVAIQKAEAELARRAVKLPASYRADATVAGRPETIDRFVWQTAGRKEYEALLGVYVPEARWRVRFATFQGDIAERAEEWNIILAGDGRVLRVDHKLPQARAGAALSEEEARLRVHAVLKETWGVEPSTLQEVSATSAKHPARVDWTFVFRDPMVKSLAPGEARLQVELAGEEPVDALRFVFVPEDWERADRALQSGFKTGAIIKGIAIAVIIITGIVIALIAWSRKKLTGRTVLAVFGLLFASMLGSLLNRWPATVAGFSTAQPLDLQRILSIVGPLVGGLFIAGSIALLAGLVSRWVRPSPVDERRALLLGVGTGLAITGGLALTLLVRVEAGPEWPSYTAAGNYVPWAVSAFGAFLQFFTKTAVLLFIFAALDRATGGWQRRRAPAALLVLVACALLMLSGGGLSLGMWLASAALSGLFLVVVYFHVLRHDLTIIPMVVAVGEAVNVVVYGSVRVYPGAMPAAVLAIITYLALGWWSTRLLRRTSNDHAAAATGI